MKRCKYRIMDKCQKNGRICCFDEECPNFEAFKAEKQLTRDLATITQADTEKLAYNRGAREFADMVIERLMGIKSNDAIDEGIICAIGCIRKTIKEMGCCDVMEDANAYGGMQLAYEKSIEVVKQAEAEYNGGWIPCSSGKLPNDFEVIYMTCVIDDGEPGVAEGVYHRTKGFIGMSPMLACGNVKVIAWMPKSMPEPYRQKDNIENRKSN